MRIHISIWTFTYIYVHILTYIYIRLLGCVSCTTCALLKDFDEDTKSSYSKMEHKLDVCCFGCAAEL